MIEYDCSGCSTHLVVGEDLAGWGYVCPSCGAYATVPGQRRKASIPSAPIRPAPPAVGAWRGRRVRVEARRKSVWHRDIGRWPLVALAAVLWFVAWSVPSKDRAGAPPRGTAQAAIDSFLPEFARATEQAGVPSYLSVDVGARGEVRILLSVRGATLAQAEAQRLAVAAADVWANHTPLGIAVSSTVMCPPTGVVAFADAAGRR